MFPILNYPDTNGARYSRASVDLSAIPTRNVPGAGVVQIAPSIRIEGWTSWSWKWSLKPGKGWTHRSKPQTRTTGKFDPSMEIGMDFEQYILLRRGLTAAGAAIGKGPAQVAFQLTGTLYEIDLDTTRWDGIGCRIEDFSGGPEKDSDDTLDVKLGLNVMDVLLDGQSEVYENTPFGQAGVLVTF